MGTRKIKTIHSTGREESAYYVLAAAIVEEACREYITNRRKAKRAVRRNKREEAEAELRSLIRFFHSSWYGELCEIDPDRLMKMLDEEADSGIQSAWLYRRRNI